MTGRVDVRASAETLAEITEVFERSRAQLDVATPLALTIATAPVAGQLPARGQPGLHLEVPAGALLVGLALLHDSVLLPTPADRVLNRNVRGLLRGLRAQWFGTEQLVRDGQPFAWVDFDRDADGRVLLIAVIGVDEPIATTPPTTMRGRPYVSLRSLGEAATSAELARKVIAGYASFIALG